jgi:hypothetical protein
MGRVIKYTLIVLLFLAVALIGVLLENISHLITYKQCMNEPMNQLSAECRKVINENL